MTRLFRNHALLKRRMLAGVLIAAVIFALLPNDFLTAGIVKADEVDVTNSTDLTINYDKLNLSYNLSDSTTGAFAYDATTKTYTWPAGVGIAQLSSVSGVMSFKIANKSQVIKKGNYFTFTFPEILKIADVGSTPFVKKVSGDDTEIGTYEIKNNVLTFHFTYEHFDITDFDEMGIGFVATVDQSQLGTASDNRYPLNKTAPEGASSYIELPTLPTKITGLTKSEGEVQSDNSVIWTVTVGSAADTGVSLAGGVLTDTLDGNQTFEDAFDANGTSIKTGFATTDNTNYTYTFPAGAVAPYVIKIKTVPTEDVLKTTGTDAVKIQNNVSYLAKNQAESEKLTASNFAQIKRTSLDKKGTIIDANTVEWKIDLNKNLANVYKATVWDELSKGLTVDEDYGIFVEEVGGSKVTLNTANPSDSTLGVSLSYSVTTTESGNQKLSVKYDSVFSKEYEITFRTKVDGATVSKDQDKINNTAYVDVTYPTGGSGTGPSIKYGSPDVEMVFFNGFIKIDAASEKDVALKTGILTWKATPSSKMASGYNGSDITLSLDAGHSFTGTGDVVVKKKDGTTVDSSKYSVTESSGKYIVTLDKEVNINDVYVEFTTKADTYFENDEEHTYKAYADLAIHAEDGQTYESSKDANNTNRWATQTLQNKLVAKSVKATFDETAREPLFTYTIKVNGNGLTLNNVHVTDDVNNILAADGIENGDFEVRSVSTSKGTVASDGKSDKKIDVSYTTLSESDTITVVLGFTAAGKAKLKVNGALSGKTISSSNTANISANELVSTGVSATINGTDAPQVVTNQMVKKSGTQVKASGNYTSTYRWYVDINSAGADLGTNPTITDVIPSGLTFATGSIKLYVAKHNAAGTVISDSDYAESDLVPAADYVKPTTVKQKNGETILTVKLPTGDAYKNASYHLVYDTVIVGDAKSFTNKATFESSDGTYTDAYTANINSFEYGSGTIYAFLTMTKVDELSAKVPVKGAKYAIFAEKDKAEGGNESDAVDVGYTNDKGQITFAVVGTLAAAGKTYYVRELAAPDNTDGNGGLYELDNTVYTISGVTYGKHTIGTDGFDGKKAFADKRKKDTQTVGTANLTNTFIDGGKDLSSEFVLYVVAGGEKKAVKLETTADGQYKFMDYSAGTTIGGTKSVVDATSGNSVSSLKITNLPWGEYHLVQTKTADGFVKAGEIVFTVGDNRTVTGATNVDNKKTVFNVKDETEGVTYKITESGEGGRTWDLTSADLKANEGNGTTFTGEMIQGKTYTISETEVPDGYKKHADVKVENFDGAEDITITETLIDIQYVLIDQNGNVLTTDGSLNTPSVVGCEKSYDITATIDDAVKNQYLSVDGAKVTVKISDNGSSASVTPSNSSVMDASYSGNTVTVTVQKIASHVLIKEVDEANESHVLTGGEFELYNKTTNEKIGTVITDTEGKTELIKDNADIKDLPVGEYYLKQTKAPSGYLIIDATKTYPITVTKDTHNKTLEVVVKHEKATGDNTVTVGTSDTRFGVRLANEYSAILGGGKFEILNESGTKVMDFTSKSLESNGIVDIQGLAPGKYTIRETDALTVNDVTYAKDDSGLTFTLNADNTVKVEKLNDVTDFLRAYDETMAKNDTKAGATLGKKDSTKKNDVALLTYTVCPTFVQFDVKVRYNEDCNENARDTAYVKGITYGVFKDEACTDGKKVAEATTDENGNVLVGGLPTGTYYVKMISKDAANVVDDETVYKVNVSGYTPNKLQHLNGTEIGTSATGKVISELNLEVNRGDVNLTKTDAEDKNVTLAGSTYAIYRRTSENVETITDYKAPTGISSRYKIFAKNFSAMVMGVPGLNEIMGANSVAAADSEWTLITTSTTDANGKLSFNNVDVGVEYMIKELSEPNGYHVSKDPILVKLVKNGSNVTLTSSDTGNGTATVSASGITWKEPRLKVGIELTDESGNALSGGTLELYDDAGNKIATWNTDGSRKVFSGELTGGKTYVIKQTKAIDGYISSNDVRFTAERKALAANDPYVQVVTVVNKKIVSSSGNAQTPNDASDTAAKTKKKSPKTGDWF